MVYFSQFYQIEVREEIAKEFTDSSGRVDDMMAGLHEIRVRRVEREYDLKELAERLKLWQSAKAGKWADRKLQKNLQIPFLSSSFRLGKLGDTGQ